MKRILAFLVALTTLGVVFSGASLVGAQSTDDEIQILGVDAGDHPEIVLTVAIPPDFADGPLGGSDFAVTEEGTPRATASTDLRDDIEVVLAIDTSGSMRPNDALGKAKTAAESLIAELPEETQIAVVGFGSDVIVASPPTTDRAQLTEAIIALDFSGDTALWDALVLSSEQFSEAENVSRYVVVLTDGVDDGSQSSRAIASSTLASAGASLYAVGLDTGGSDFTPLQAVAAEVGGGFSTADSADSLTPLYTEIGERLRSRYRLAFEAEGYGEREVVISVATENGLATVRRVIDLGGSAPAEAPAEEARESAFPSQLNSITGADVGWLGQGTAYWAGIVALFAAFAVLAYLMIRPAQRIQLANVQKSGDRVSGFSDRVTNTAGGYLAGTERGTRLDNTLDAAGMEVRPGEVFVFTLVGAMVGFMIGFWASGGFLAIALAALAPLVAYTIISRRLRKRRTAFADQLESTLTMMAGALRAGRAIPQTIDLVAEEGASPTGDEFRRVVIETRVGRDVVVALEEVAVRMDSEDFSWVAEAVAVNRELGGDLAEVLQNIGAVIRDRNQVRQQVRALAAEGRMSAIVLVALPIALFFYLQIVTPDYGGELLTGTGLIALLGGIVLIFLGGLWMRKLVSLEY